MAVVLVEVELLLIMVPVERAVMAGTDLLGRELPVLLALLQEEPHMALAVVVVVQEALELLVVLVVQALPV
jgi:hypothetical protein